MFSQNGLTTLKIFAQEHVSRRGLNGWRQGMREMFNLLGRAFRSSESITPWLPGLFQNQGEELIILLAGGDKSSQADDIKTALRLARNL
mgnify:CR=1 FL=1